MFMLLLTNPAPLHHQFHDGFARGEDYPASYNNIKNNLEAAGKLDDTSCPFV
jgi:hypothetical protein